MGMLNIMENNEGISPPTLHKFYAPLENYE
jgi:hypothetical protein